MNKQLLQLIRWVSCVGLLSSPTSMFAENNSPNILTMKEFTDQSVNHHFQEEETLKKSLMMWQQNTSQIDWLPDSSLDGSGYLLNEDGVKRTDKNVQWTASVGLNYNLTQLTRSILNRNQDDLQFSVSMAELKSRHVDLKKKIRQDYIALLGAKQRYEVAVSQRSFAEKVTNTTELRFKQSKVQDISLLQSKNALLAAKHREQTQRELYELSIKKCEQWQGKQINMETLQLESSLLERTPTYFKLSQEAMISQLQLGQIASIQSKNESVELQKIKYNATYQTNMPSLSLSANHALYNNLQKTQIYHPTYRLSLSWPLQFYKNYKQTKLAFAEVTSSEFSVRQAGEEIKRQWETIVNQLRQKFEEDKRKDELIQNNNELVKLAYQRYQSSHLDITSYLSIQKEAVNQKFDQLDLRQQIAQQVVEASALSNNDRLIEEWL